MPRYSRLALVCVVILTLSGVLTSALRLDSPAELVTSKYGAIVMFKVIDLMGLLRISKEGEIEGMDIHEHGISAYPEYVIAASFAPAGMSPESVNSLARDSAVVGRPALQH